MSDAISIRRTAFIWLAGLMAAIGICAAAGSYLLARREAADFLDNQLRQVALYVGDTPSAPGPTRTVPARTIRRTTSSSRSGTRPASRCGNHTPP